MRSGFYWFSLMPFIFLLSNCVVDPTDRKTVGERVPNVFRCNAFERACTITQGDSQLRYQVFKLGNNKYRIEGHIKTLASSGSSKVSRTAFAYYFVKNNVIVAVGPRFSITGGDDTTFKKEIKAPEESGNVLGEFLQPDNFLLFVRVRHIGQY